MTHKQPDVSNSVPLCRACEVLIQRHARRSTFQRFGQWFYNLYIKSSDSVTCKFPSLEFDEAVQEVNKWLIDNNYENEPPIPINFL